MSTLIEKYERLLELRVERESLEASGVLSLDGEAGRERKRRCRALARSYPGVLRELEHLSAAAIKARLEALRGGKAAAFAQLVERYHELGRAMGRLKHWQGGFRAKHGRQPSVEEAAVQLGPDCTLAPAVLAEWLVPPEGRPHEAVWRVLAAQWGTTPEALKQVLYTPGAETRFFPSGAGAKEGR